MKGISSSLQLGLQPLSPEHLTELLAFEGPREAGVCVVGGEGGGERAKGRTSHRRIPGGRIWVRA